MNFLHRLCGLLLLTTVFTPHRVFGADADLARYEDMKINEITIDTSQHSQIVQKSLLKSRLKTKEGEKFNQHDFDEDLKILAKEFDHVEPTLQVRDNHLDITLTILPKPTVRSIKWIGNKGIKTERLEKKLEITKNTVFDRQSFNKAFHKLQAYYVKEGYFEAQLDYEIVRDQKEDVVDVIIKIKEGRAGRIQKIVFHNVTKKEEDALLELMMTKEYSFFTSWLTDEGTLNLEMFQHDELGILNFFHNEGYADAKLDVKLNPSEKEQRIIVDITVDKGPLYTFDTLHTRGNTIFTEEELLQIVSCKKGDPYSPEKVRQIMKAIFDKYGSKGYIDAAVTPEARLVPSTHTYRVDFKIEEGKRYRVGLIKVFGNNRTQTSVILHETPLIPGNVFDARLIQKTEERLRNIGYFKNVNVYAVKTQRGQDGGANFRDVYVEVEENPTTGNFNIFALWSTTEGVAGGLGARETNFNFRGIPQVFTKGLKALRGGGEYLGANVIVGKKQLSYTLAWTKPYFMDTPWIVGWELQKSRNDFVKEYTLRSNRALIHGYYPINTFLKWGVQYRLQHTFVRLGHEKKETKQLRKEASNGGLISAVGTSLLYDSTDHPARPRRGVRSSLELEFAGLGGDHNFVSAHYLNNIYYSPYPQGVFRFRGNLQFLKTLGSTHPRDLPFAERFYLGGELMMRGYRYNAVGPHFKDSRHTPRGGVSSIFFSADYDQYIFKKLDGFVFFDAGNVYFKQLHLGELRYSAGFGVKIKLAENMPLVVGMGFPLNPQRKSDVRHLFFSFGAAF